MYTMCRLMFDLHNGRAKGTRLYTELYVTDLYRSIMYLPLTNDHCNNVCMCNLIHVYVTLATKHFGVIYVSSKEELMNHNTVLTQRFPFKGILSIVL